MKKYSGFTLVELMIVIAIVGLLAAIAIPQYQLYVLKTQVHRVMIESGALRANVEHCISNGNSIVGGAAGQCDPGAVGSNLLAGGSQVGATLGSGTGVPQVSSPLITFPITITSTFGGSSSPVLTGVPTTLIWTRDVGGSWVCTTTAPVNVRPQACL